MKCKIKDLEDHSFVGATGNSKRQLNVSTDINTFAFVKTSLPDDFDLRIPLFPLRNDDRSAFTIEAFCVSFYCPLSRPRGIPISHCLDIASISPAFEGRK